MNRYFISLAVACTCVFTTFARAEEPAVFERLPLEHPATAMALTADGNWLVVAHDAANELTVWDVATGKLARKVECKSPQYVLCRDTRVFVANGDEFTVTIYDMQNDWKITKLVQPLFKHGGDRVSRMPAAFLSAAKGDSFNNKLLVFPNWNSTTACLIDIESGEWKNTGFRSCPRGEMSYDGRSIMWQSFSKDDNPRLLSLDQRSNRDDAEKKGMYPRLYQTYPGELWIGGGRIYKGRPVKALTPALGQMLIADQSRQLLYALDGDRIRAVTLTEKGVTRIPLLCSLPVERILFSLDSVLVEFLPVAVEVNRP